MAERAALDGTGTETYEAEEWKEYDRTGDKTAAEGTAEPLAATDDGSKKDAGDDKHAEEPKEYIPKEEEPPQVK